MSRSYPMLPFRTIPESGISLESETWLVTVEGRAPHYLSHGDAFREWDPQLKFLMSRTLSWGDGLGKLLWGDSGEFGCEVVVVAASGSVGLRRLLLRAPIPIHRAGSIELTIEPPSTELANWLSLQTRIVLSQDLSVHDGLAPRVRGNRIWGITERFRLEGGTTRLPLYETPFDVAFRGRRQDAAHVAVEVRDDPELEFEAAVAVYLNTSQKEFLSGLVVGDETREWQLWTTVVRAVLASAGAGEWLDDHAYEPQTLGGTVQRWALQVAGIETVQQLREKARSAPAELDAQVDSWVSQLLSSRRKRRNEALA